MSNEATPLTQKYKLYITNDGLDSATSDNAQRICLFNASNVKIKYNGKNMSLSLNGVSFRRKIYEPGHIEAEVQIGYSGAANLPKLSDLQTMFIKKKVDLEIAVEKVKKDMVLAKNYYIHEICPQYSSSSKETSVYVRLSIFSMDKLMTLNKFSQAYLGKTFGAGVMIPAVTDFKLVNAKSTYKINSAVCALEHLADANGKEYVLPYLVQYNESFYDFLVRVANRSGEFLFFENGMLQLGLDTEKRKIARGEVKEKECAKVDVYSAIHYQQISGNPLEIDDYAFDSMSDKAAALPGGGAGTWNIDEVKRKDKSDEVEKKTEGTGNNSNVKEKISKNEYLGYPYDVFPASSHHHCVYNAEMATDEQYMLLVKDQFSNYDLWGQIDAVGTNLMTMLSTILNSTTVLEALSKLGVMLVETGVQGRLKQGKVNDTGNKVVEAFKTVHDNMSTPFASSDTSTWMTTASYSGIRKSMEEQSRKMVCVDAGSQFVNVKLGDMMKMPFDDAVYIVVQIDMRADQEWDSDYEDNYAGNSISHKGGRLLKYYLIPALYKTEGSGNSTVTKTELYPPLLKTSPFRKADAQNAFVMDNADPKGQGRVRVRYPWQPNVAVSKDALDKEIDEIKKKLEAEQKRQEDNNEGNESELAKSYKSAILQKEMDKVLLDASTPWIRMATPMATPGGGMYFKPEKGDEVIVDYESGNVERPYVVGTLFSKNTVAPDTDRIIKSPNGHRIKIEDPTDGTKLLAGMFPGLKFLQSYQIWPSKAKIEGMNKVLGGITLTDAYGMYKISMSSHDRKVAIASPFGDVKIDAFTGISISAPNGDIKIKGKNVSISASNNLTITSGENVKPVNANGNFFKAGWSVKNVTKSLATTVLESTVGKFVDFSLLRSLVEVFLRPIDGTMEVKSYRYLKLIGGGGYAEVDDGLYKKAGTNLKGKKGNDGYAQLGNMVAIVNARIDDFVDKYYTALSTMHEDWQAVLNANLYAQDAPLLTQPADINALFQAVYATDKAATELPINVTYSDGVAVGVKAAKNALLLKACNSAVALKDVSNSYATVYGRSVPNVKKLLGIDKVFGIFSEKGISVMAAQCDLKELVDKTKQHGNNTKAAVESNWPASDEDRAVFKEFFANNIKWIKRKLVSDVLEESMGKLKVFWNFKLSKRDDHGVAAATAVANGGNNWTAYINNIDIPEEDSAGSAVWSGLLNAFKDSVTDKLTLERDVWAPGTKGDILFSNNSLETKRFVGNTIATDKNLYVTQADKKKVVGRIRELLISFG